MESIIIMTFQCIFITFWSSKSMFSWDLCCCAYISSRNHWHRLVGIQNYGLIIFFNNWYTERKHSYISHFPMVSLAFFRLCSTEWGKKSLTSVWRLGQKSGISDNTVKLGSYRSSWRPSLCSLPYEAKFF